MYIISVGSHMKASAIKDLYYKRYLKTPFSQVKEFDNQG